MKEFMGCLAETEEDPADDVVRRALQTVRRHLGMEVAYLCEFDGGRSIFRTVEAEGEAPLREGDSAPLDAAYYRRMAEDRSPQLVPDVGRQPGAAALPGTAAMAMGSHVSVPVRREDGSLFGSFCCASARPKPALSDHDLRVVEMVADLSADRIEGAVSRRLRHDETRARIEAAMAEGGLEMVYQPIFELGSRRASGFEALARFRSEPYRPPNLWFAEAESVGLGLELELAAIRAALPALNELPDEVYVSVNAAPATVASGRLAELFAGYSPGRIVLEITEHAVAESDERLLAEISGLRAKGVRLAIDDAGAGFAGLSQIVRLSPDIIKLDRSLVTGIDSHAVRRSLAGALVGFAAGCSATLVAEGVESDAELATLRELEVPRGQGWLLGRPAALDIARRYATPACPVA